MPAAVAGVYAVLLVISAIGKLTHWRWVVAYYESFGVRERWLNPLAVVLLAGAAGLLLGLWWWRPLGIAAAAGLVIYFVLAVGVHLRIKHYTGLFGPTLMLGLAVATLWLQISAP